ncbi:tetratricopeptide repeat protein [Pleionea sediminis]|uniref:tetratricopeptide repeat protein n=1 Tax=Pleionea sediminis TaxID=2569479 RepID=UPI0011868DDF|nr:tetratricopeptide repeat protein [Pleionea sediminis]
MSLKSLTPIGRRGLSMAYAFKPKSIAQRNQIPNQVVCLSCGVQGQFINGDSGPLRQIESVVYYRAGLICQCHYLNFVNTIVNDIPEENTKNKVSTESALEDLQAKEKMPDWRDEELITLSAAAAHNQEFELASTLVDIALTISPFSQAAWYNRGWLYANDKDLDSAINAYKKTLIHGDDFPSAYLNLGYIYQEFHQFEEAARAFKKFLEHYPTHPDALSRLKDCEDKSED